MEQARLLSMTFVLTALIWASADRLVNDTATVSAVVVPVAADASSNIIVSSGPRQEELEISISGPRRVVETVQNRGGLQIRLPIQEQPTGTAMVSLDDNMVRRELAERWSEFDRLRVLDLKPEAIAVEVDHLISRDVELVARKSTLAYEVEPQLQRNMVKLQLRESQSPPLPAGETMRVDISAEVERLLKEKPFGRSHAMAVQLDARPFGPDAVFMPASVEVTATVRSERGTEEVPTVPVLVAMSFGNLEKSISAVSRDGTPLSLVTQTITVTGAPEAVDRLVRGETRAYGIIQLKEDDIRELGVVKLMTPDYHLPPGIELATEPAPIELKLVSKSNTENQ
jgi:hypothetical protein